MVIFYCTDCPDVDERLLQSDAESGVTELETSIQLDQNVETPGQVDRSSLQAEMRLIRPAVRKSRKERKNIPDDVPTPPPTSSSDDDLFEPVKKVKKKTFRKKK